MSGEEEVIEVTIDMVELKKMKVPELKKKVSELGLSTKGTKAELLARVEKYVSEQEEEEELLEDEEVEGEEEDVEEEAEAEGEGEVEEGDEGVEEGERGEEESGEGTVEGGDVGETGKEQTQPTNDKAHIATSPTIKKTIVSTSDLANCHAERVAQRAAKFGGNTSEEAKKLARAERFGTTLENVYKGLGKRATPTGEELEKLKKRAERFGSSVSPAITCVEEDEKKKKRVERFGLTATDLGVEERKKMRGTRFGTS